MNPAQKPILTIQRPQQGRGLRLYSVVTNSRALLAKMCIISTEKKRALDARAWAIFSSLILERPRATSNSEFRPYHFSHAPKGKPTNSVSAELTRSLICGRSHLYFFAFSTAASFGNELLCSYLTITSCPRLVPGCFPGGSQAVPVAVPRCHFQSRLHSTSLPAAEVLLPHSVSPPSVSTPGPELGAALHQQCCLGAGIQGAPGESSKIDRITDKDC